MVQPLQGVVTAIQKYEAGLGVASSSAPSPPRAPSAEGGGGDEMDVALDMEEVMSNNSKSAKASGKRGGDSRGGVGGKGGERGGGGGGSSSRYGTQLLKDLHQGLTREARAMLLAGRESYGQALQQDVEGAVSSGGGKGGQDAGGGSSRSGPGGGGAASSSGGAAAAAAGAGASADDGAAAAAPDPMEDGDESMGGGGGAQAAPESTAEGVEEQKAAGTPPPEEAAAAAAAATAAASDTAAGATQQVDAEAAEAMAVAAQAQAEEDEAATAAAVAAAAVEGAAEVAAIAARPGGLGAQLRDFGGVANPLLELASTLCPERMGLAVAHILAAQVDVCPYDERFMPLARQLLLQCPAAHMQQCPKHFFAVCERFSQQSISNDLALKAIRPLQVAAERLAPSNVCLTPVHTELLHCAISAKCYHVAFKLLEDRPVLEVQPKNTALTAVHLLRYFYYGGVACVALKRWKKAILQFQMVISTPASSLSAIAVAAYKKMILCGLILSGAPPELPKYTSPGVMRAIRLCVEKYSKFAKCFKAGKADKLQELYKESEETFRSDGNCGLAKQALTALTRQKISKLTHSYITLNLQDMANSVGLSSAAEAEDHLLHLIDRGELCAAIEHPSGTVLFKEDAEEFSSNRMHSKLESELAATVKLCERVKAIDDRISISHEYISKTQQSGDAYDTLPLGAPPPLDDPSSSSSSAGDLLTRSGLMSLGPGSSFM